MGTMVIVNFVLVVTYFPAVVVLYSKNGFEGRGIEVEKRKEKDEELSVKKQWLEIFCIKRYAPTMFSTKTRALAVLISSLAISAVFLSQALALEPSQTDFKVRIF